MTAFGSPYLAIDLGTATTRVAGGRSGICLRPSVAPQGPALNRGVIVNLNAAIEVLRPMIQRRRRARIGRLRVLACAPSDVTALERNMVRSCILEAGAFSVIVVPEPLAAAVGSGIDIGGKYAKLLVDFGDGVTDCALIRDGQIADSVAERVGCSNLRAVIRNFVWKTAGLTIAEAEAERLLRKIGLTRQGEERCRGHVNGQPAAGRIQVAALQEELWPVVTRMLAPLKTLLKEIPASIAVEVIEDGIFLTGGGALLPGLRERVAAFSAIHTQIVPDPVAAVICGARRMLPIAAKLDLWNGWGTYQRAFLSPETRHVVGRSRAS